VRPEGLPPEASRTGTIITIDVAAKKLYLFQDGQLVDKSLVATGSERTAEVFRGGVDRPRHACYDASISLYVQELTPNG
jgi:hypothetical protein